MKTMSKIFGLLLVLAVAFTSCGDDDDGPAPTLTTQRVTHVHKISIVGFENSPISRPVSTLKLDSIIGKVNASNFVGATFQPASSHLVVSGLGGISQTISLKDFSLKVGSRTAVNLGVTSPTPPIGGFLSDSQQSGGEFTNSIKTMFDDAISSNRKADIVLSYTPSQDIVATDNVSLVITIVGDYQYNVYK